MDKCQKIEAHIRMEERYEGLSLIFGDNRTLKNDIIDAIDETKKETGKKPFIFDKISNDRPDIQCIYIEFRDDVHREAGDFFTRILKKLNIDHCEKDI